MAIILWNRRFQPAALVLSYAAVVLATSWTLAPAFTGWPQVVAVAAAAAIALLMVVAWLRISQSLLGYGYLLSAGLWVFVTWAAAINATTPTDALFALGFALLAGGSYLLEVRDGDGRWLP